MDYDRIILELLNRVALLEEKVTGLQRGVETMPMEKTTGTSKKYRFLSDYLYNANGRIVRLSFGEIEKILNEKLPNSAYIHRAFWANTESHSVALSWLSVEYQTTEVDLDKKYVVFEKKRSY